MPQISEAIIDGVSLCVDLHRGRGLGADIGWFSCGIWSAEKDRRNAAQGCSPDRYAGEQRGRQGFAGAVRHDARSTSGQNGEDYGNADLDHQGPVHDISRGVGLTPMFLFLAIYLPGEMEAGLKDSGFDTRRIHAEQLGTRWNEMEQDEGVWRPALEPERRAKPLVTYETIGTSSSATDYGRCAKWTLLLLAPRSAS